MEDCVIHALLELGPDERLSDLLNEVASVPMHDLFLYALDDGREVRAERFDVDVGELYAVEALDNPHGSRHVHTRTTRVEISSGPYRIVGNIHGPVGADPALNVMRRPRMIPLTDARIEFEFIGRPMTVESDVVIFNRAVARGVRAADYGHEPQMPTLGG